MQKISITHSPKEKFGTKLTLNFGAVLSFLLRMTQRTPLKVTRMKWWARSRMVNTERMQSQNLDKKKVEAEKENKVRTNQRKT